jgi:Icc-related predicted phosphoesterase
MTYPGETNLTTCFFVSDLHGSIDRYEKLFAAIAQEKPTAVFLGGDLLPSGIAALTSADSPHQDFISDYLASKLSSLRQQLGKKYPRVFVILGNDDGRFEEAAFVEASKLEIWEYVHNRKVAFADYTVYGYACVPPTPFLLKDWERYDVSRYVDPGCVSPEEGVRSAPISEHEKRYGTIAKDLQLLIGTEKLDKAIILFHTPPYNTNLDRIGSDGRMVDHVPMETHIGSVAVRRLIESRQPLVTLHGHAHESARITGSWHDRIGTTHMFSAAHDGPELALVRFELEHLDDVVRELI